MAPQPGRWVGTTRDTPMHVYAWMNIAVLKAQEKDSAYLVSHKSSQRFDWEIIVLEIRSLKY